MRWLPVMIAGAVLANGHAARASQAPSPSPSATARALGFDVHGDVKILFLTQGVRGPGLQPVEGQSFARGGVAAPVSPYDLLSGAPIVPGNVQQNQITLHGTWHARTVDVRATLGIESLLGDRTNQGYWAEPLQPQDNVHLGSSSNGLKVIFPAHPGTDDFSGVRAGLTQVEAKSEDGHVTVTGGWLKLRQNLAFVFTAPPTTNALPLLTLKTPESLNPNPTSLSGWDPPTSTLPMRGFDASFPVGKATVEATDAQLPSPPGTPARLVSLSAGGFNAANHGFMVQAVHVSSGGDAIATTTGFGRPSGLVVSDQGLFAVSTLYSQRQAIVGGRLSEPVGLGIDAAVEYARSTYRADKLGKPQTAVGSWEHASIAHPLGAATVAAHFYRFEPTYATMILPYGVPENVWSVAYSWPGPWLKSNFQLVDSSSLGVNRQGPSFSYIRDSKTLYVSATFSSFRQIAPFTVANFRNLGLIDGFFLVQPDPMHGTFGTYHRAAIYLGKRVKFGDFGLDFVDDDLHRNARVDEPFDAVSYDAPQTVLSWSHEVQPHMLLAAGVGYFGMRGSWADGAATNVDYGMHVAYAGAQFQERRSNAVMLTLRHSVLRGAPFFGTSNALPYRSPNFDGTLLLLEQRVKI